MTDCQALNGRQWISPEDCVRKCCFRSDAKEKARHNAARHQPRQKPACDLFGTPGLSACNCSTKASEDHENGDQQQYKINEEQEGDLTTAGADLGPEKGVAKFKQCDDPAIH